MNKKLIWIVSCLIFIGVLIGGFVFFKHKNYTKNSNGISYYCQEGNFDAQFGANYVVLTFTDGKNTLLPQAISGSGMRYELGNTSFIGKGDNAFITEGTTTVYSNCVTGSVVSKKDKNIFTDASKTFSFSYPKQFMLSGGEIGYSQDWSAESSELGLVLAVVNIPKTFLPSTNFSGAKFSVGTSADPSAVKNCLASSGGSSVSPVEINLGGRKFTKLTFSDAGAGNYYDTVSYRTVLNDQCYSVEYTIHSTNINNYDPSQGITEFDKDKISSIFENIVQSFYFI